jgi:hypothetical protein
MGPWSLVACWCSPAFRDKHFTLGDADELTYPDFANEIRTLTRDAGGAPAEGR